MSAEQVPIEDIGALRAQLRGKPKYRLELLAAILKVSRDHHIDLSDELTERLTFADEFELDLMRGPDHKDLRRSKATD